VKAAKAHQRLQCCCCWW